MEKLTTLLLDHPSAVLKSGVVIPCSLLDLLGVSLDDANGLPLRASGPVANKAGHNGIRVGAGSLRA